MMAHPLALQLRNLQSLVEIGVDKNTTVFPSPTMTTIAELTAFIHREADSAGTVTTPAHDAAPSPAKTLTGTPDAA